MAIQNPYPGRGLGVRLRVGKMLSELAMICKRQRLNQERKKIRMIAEQGRAGTQKGEILKSLCTL